ncbi:uncharacterized protein LJ206_006534 isoform 2-T2 [Theristicus caerulescens]
MEVSHYKGCSNSSLQTSDRANEWLGLSKQTQSCNQGYLVDSLNVNVCISMGQVVQEGIQVGAATAFDRTRAVGGHAESATIRAPSLSLRLPAASPPQPAAASLLWTVQLMTVL